MKLTDISICFFALFICLLTVIHINEKVLYNKEMVENMYDNVMDGIVEDALRAGYKAIDYMGCPKVDMYEILKCFEAEKKLYESYDRTILIYVDKDGFYCYDSDYMEKWGDKIDFSGGENTSHELIIRELTSYIESTYPIIVNIPYNHGETWLNTVDMYSLIGISLNKHHDITSFSGAKIHKIK